MLKIDQELIERANAVSMFDAGNSIAKDYEQAYQIGLDKLHKLTAYTDEQREYIAARISEWLTVCEQHAAEALRRRASWVPWTVAGPSNYNAKRNGKKADAAINAEKENAEKEAAFLKNTADHFDRLRPLEVTLDLIRKGRINPEISATDPNAAELLQAKIDRLTARREEGKRMNAHYKKYGSMQHFETLTDEEAARFDEALKKQIWPVQFAPYELQNSLAEVKRLQARLAEIERIKSAPAVTHNAAAPFQIVEDTAAMRINIITEDKPAADVIAAFKAAGFHWSPRAKVWTRQLTDNARRSVSRLLQQFAADETAPEPAADNAAAPFPVVESVGRRLSPAVTTPQTGEEEQKALTVSEFLDLVKAKYA